MKLAPPSRSRRKFLAGALACGISPLVYVRWMEPRWLDVSRRQVPLGLASPIRLLHLSDFHYSADVPLPYIQRAIETGLRMEPDLVCITGDFVTHGGAEAAAYVQILKQLCDAKPTFACAGNHDGGKWARQIGGYADLEPVRELLVRSGVQLLYNETRRYTTRGQSLHLAGLGDLWAEEMDAGKALRKTPDKEGIPLVLLSHNPDSKDHLRDYAWNLMLCGHTHGGQLRVPLVGTPFAPVKDQRYVQGLHRWQNRYLHISRGVGNLHGVRFNCRPEISLLQLG